jgi:hypothetical protein
MLAGRQVSRRDMPFPMSTVRVLADSVWLCHLFSAELEPSVFVRLAQRRQRLHPCNSTNVILTCPD